MANNNNNKDGQNRAGRDSNTQNQAGRSNQSQGQGRSGAMSPEEAGHLGGAAPHSCRGFECQEQGQSSSKDKDRDNK